MKTAKFLKLSIQLMTRIIQDHHARHLQNVYRGIGQTQKRRPDVKVYKHLNKVVGLQNIKIVLISKHYFVNKEQLLRVEDEVAQANKNQFF